jgi:hypothetical protein
MPAGKNNLALSTLLFDLRLNNHPINITLREAKDEETSILSDPYFIFKSQCDLGSNKLC